MYVGRVFPRVLTAFFCCFAFTANAAGFNDTAGRTQVDCHSSTANEIVLLTFGQSISANHGEAGNTPRGDVVNYNPNDGHCYAATDPLLGASANFDSHVGSIWGYLCDDLLATRHWNRCIIASIAQDSTKMHDWSPDGAMNHLLREAVEGLRINGLAPSAILYG